MRVALSCQVWLGHGAKLSASAVTTGGMISVGRVLFYVEFVLDEFVSVELLFRDGRLKA